MGWEISGVVDTIASQDHAQVIYDNVKHSWAADTIVDAIDCSVVGSVGRFHYSAWGDDEGTEITVNIKRKD